LCKKSSLHRCVTLDLTLFISLFIGAYLLSGYLGDLSLTNLVKSLLPKNFNGTLNYMPFLAYSLWSGRIWFWGFIVFFFVLGIVGSICYCCFRDEGRENDYGHEHYSHSSCWWIFCGPSYYNGYYYYSPYGYWGPGDLLCLWWLTSPHYGHQYGCLACCYGCDNCAHGCNPSDCSTGNSDCGKDGIGAIFIVVIIVVLIFVIIGVLVGSVLTFLLVNKIMKRHLTLLERQANTQKFVVCNLDDESEVNEAEYQEKNGRTEQFAEVIVHKDDIHLVNEPLNKPPKGKVFDTYQQY